MLELPVCATSDSLDTKLVSVDWKLATVCLLSYVSGSSKCNHIAVAGAVRQFEYIDDIHGSDNDDDDQDDDDECDNCLLFWPLLFDDDYLNYGLDCVFWAPRVAFACICRMLSPVVVVARLSYLAVLIERRRQTKQRQLRPKRRPGRRQRRR